MFLKYSTHLIHCSLNPLLSRYPVNIGSSTSRAGNFLTTNALFFFLGGDRIFSVGDDLELSIEVGNFPFGLDVFPGVNFCCPFGSLTFSMPGAVVVGFTLKDLALLTDLVFDV